MSNSEQRKTLPQAKCHKPSLLFTSSALPLDNLSKARLPTFPDLCELVKYGLLAMRVQIAGGLKGKLDLPEHWHEWMVG